MNVEQVEGQLREYRGLNVCVCVPIRGTVHMTFYGGLDITEHWEEEHPFILYSVRHWPDADVCFRAQDVLKIKENPTTELAAAITLKTEDWMTEEKLAHNI